MQNAETMRERLFTMRMSEEEAGRLDVVAKHYGLNGAGVIRMLLKKEEREMHEIAERVTGSSDKVLAASRRVTNLGDKVTALSRQIREPTRKMLEVSDQARGLPGRRHPKRKEKTPR